MKINWKLLVIIGAILVVIVWSLLVRKIIQLVGNEDNIDSPILTCIEEQIINLPQNTIIKHVYIEGSKEKYLLYDPTQHTYEKCYVMDGELITEIIFIQN